MSEIKNGGPAFPRSGANWTGKENQAMGNDASLGMTLRDYFAAKAMQAFVSSYPDGAVSSSLEDVADDSYAMADAMIKAREA